MKGYRLDFVRLMIAAILVTMLFQAIQPLSRDYAAVIAAGDSITAGLGARWSYTRPTLFAYEDCGVSFATGGDDDTISIARLIERDYGHEVGGVFCPRDPIRIRRRDDGYNVALTGATSEALPLQFEELKKRYEEDHKNINARILLTLLIGANDLCMWDCHRPAHQLSSFKTHVSDFINSVNDYFGDVDVLVGEIPSLEGIPERASGTGMAGFALLECPCAYYKALGDYSFAKRIDLYNEFLRSLTRIDRVKVTAVLREDELKDWPMEMTSKLDAFHPSKWAQEHFALKIYNELQ